VVEDEVHGLLVEELERREDLAEPGAGLFEDVLDALEARNREQGDVDGLPGGDEPCPCPMKDGRTLERLGVRMETPVMMPMVPSEPMKSCLRS
jgi:hypothetical protein